MEGRGKGGYGFAVPVDLVIIIPVFDEAENVLPLAEEVAAGLKNTGANYELVFVDDASRDETWQRIAEAARRDSRVRGLRHRANRGQSAAVWTGIQATSAPLIGTLDGDRQNDPADLPKLLAELPVADFACGVRVNRQDSWVRRVSSNIARRARRSVLGADFRDTGCALRVFKRPALEGLFPFNGFHRFLPLLVHGGGFTVKEVPVNHRPRVAGVSKYGVWNRMGRGIADLFALAWYQRRRLRPVAYDELPRETAGAAKK
ncbi:MAG TPA: glycosyltransferase family 2 protein [Verrucomicrobiae bacterium]|nr:glycosyltransferase family 2 protein [Verrucomicrobiae bacterium]